MLRLRILRRLILESSVVTEFGSTWTLKINITTCQFNLLCAENQNNYQILLLIVRLYKSFNILYDKYFLKYGFMAKKWGADLTKFHLIASHLSLYFSTWYYRKSAMCLLIFFIPNKCSFWIFFLRKNKHLRKNQSCSHSKLKAQKKY